MEGALRVECLRPSSLEEAAGALEAALSSRDWVVVWGRCSAEYEGRSASRLSPGDVLVMVKPDRSVIVHGPRGFKPLNWQPDASAVTVAVEGGELVLRAVRKSLREVLVLRCGAVHLVAWGRGAVGGDFYMYVDEHEIRDYLAEHPEEIEEGLEVVRVEKPVEPGFVDLYGRDSRGRIVVMELKRVKAGEEAARQLLRYVAAFRSRGVEVRGILVAPDFTEAALRLLSEAGLEYRRIRLERIYEWVKSRRRRGRGLLDFIGSSGG